MSSEQSVVVDAARQAKIEELVKYIEELVAHNLPDEMTNRTCNPEYNDIVKKGVGELGYRDTRHFCESFPEKFQVVDLGWEYIISLRSALPRERPSYMMNTVPVAVRLACDCFVRPEDIATHVCRCPNCNMRGHLVDECPSPPRST